MVSYHLIVLVHGLWGNYTNMEYIESQLENIKTNDPNCHIVVLKTGSHAGYLTYDGIDVNGKRVADEILQKVEQLTDSIAGDSVSKISIIGYSLGGLISRYAVGVLHSGGFFKHVEAVNFITFCTPHVGSLNPGNNFSVRVFNYFVPHILAHSGSQLFLVDKKPAQGYKSLPLLVWMADPRSLFYKGLEQFKHRTLYANIINDKRASWFTSAISVMDPFMSMLNRDSSIYKLDYIPNYAPTVVDIKQPILLTKTSSEVHSNLPPTSTPWLSYLGSGAANFVQRKVDWLKFVGTLVVVTPIWASYMLARSAYERIRLNIRVNTFFLENSNSLHHLYDQEEEDEEIYVANEISDRTDRLIELAYQAIGHERNLYHYSVTNEAPANALVVAEPLSLTEYQLQIIQNLNKLNWNKFPVLIRNTKLSHAASIVKVDRSEFNEGKLIITHLINEVLKLD